MQDDIEIVGIEADSLIFNELIEEVVCDLVHWEWPSHMYNL